jgi:diguanylate cyclase (GGDEF)-like protein
MLGRAIAASLRAARLDEERRARLHGIERVLDVSRGLVGDPDRRRTVATVIDAAGDLLGADRVLIARRTRDGTFRIEGESDGPDDGTWRSRALDERDSVALAAISSGVTIALAGGVQAGIGSGGSGSAGTGSDAGHPIETGRPTIALPIHIEDEVAAVLVASRAPEAAPFGALERGLGELLATQVGVALHNADRHATAHDAAVRDPLTGLLNRRYFDEAVETAFAAARRAGEPLSLIVLDLDRFSAVNNEHGHAAGDVVLRAVGRAIVANVRLEDTVARYGGEEFVVIAPRTDTAAAVMVAERIRAAIAALEPEGLRITTSAGVASLLADEVDGHALFRAADSALLAAKRAGRDRVVSL